MKRGDLILVLMIIILLSLAGLTVRYNHELTLNLRPKMVRIDPGVLAQQLQSGNLSSKKADFFQAVGREGGSAAGNSGKILIQDSKPEPKKTMSNE